MYRKINFRIVWIGIIIMLGLFCGNVFAKNNISISGGNWKEVENGYEAKNKSFGDQFLLTDTYVDGTKSFIFECRVKFTGNAVGVVFGAANKNRPSNSWYCLNLERPSSVSRAFFVRGGLAWNITTGVSQELLSRNTNLLRVVFIANDSISFYVDETHIGTYPAKDFVGGYLGVMTCYADCTFTDMTYQEFDADKVNSIEFLNVEFDKEYTPDYIEYLSYVDYSVEDLRFKMEYPSSIDITIIGEDGIEVQATSGKEISIPLQIGYNKVTISKTYNINDEIKSSSVIYLNVHRAQKDSLLYNESYRPQLHYSSKTEWINDPNGMMYNSATGEYHLFYQSRPRTSAFDPNQCWYHAVSKDLIHWEQIEPAIEPDNLGFCWSGSGGIDVNNTSGFFDEDSDPASRMVIIYSSVYGDTYYGVEKISLAYSKDNGKTWIKYDGNPIIKNGSNHQQKYTDGFRDPKLIWYEDSSYEKGGIWIMLVGGGQGRLFVSENLVDWTYQSALVGVDKKALHGECPDFFKISVENEPGVEKWVYVSGQVDLNTNPQIFQTSAVVGHLEKNQRGKFVFVAEQDLKQIFYGGNTMYATQSFHTTADGRRIQISWLREWMENTGINLNDQDVKDWNGLMSWPMELKLYNVDGKYIFKSYPIEEMTKLRSDTIFSKDSITITPETKNIFSKIQGKYSEIVVKANISKAGSVTFKLREGENGSVNVIISDYDAASGTVKVTADGSMSGKHKGNSASVITSAKNGEITLRMVVDNNCIDVYCNEGENSVYALAYPDPDNTKLSLSVNSGELQIESIKVYELESIWKNEKSVDDTTPDDNDKQESGMNIMKYIIVGVICTFVLIVGGGSIYFIKKKK
ncbi:MAG: glycoside hydrolase family 32 protein [Ruminococcaceae bacterium]|nr:glycoside hydrolase family 32 protein [Oscillospiraceae bacterium]